MSSIKNSRKEVLFSELHSLLSSGLDFSHSFRLLIASEEKIAMKTILQSLYDAVVGGVALWQAMKHNGNFSALDCGVIRIGEETGRLTEVLDFLANYYHKKVEQQRMISSAISYPLIILCTAIVVVIFMLGVIVPMFEQVYARMGGELPALTKWIISLSKSLPIYAAIAVSLTIIISIVLYRFRETDAVRSGIADIVMKIPIVNKIIRGHNQAQFCKLLYLLTSSGVPLLHGIDMLKTVITFYPYQHSFGIICNGLERGELFSTNLEKSPNLYNRKLTTLLRVGEETNRLSQMLQKQADDLTKELEYMLRQLGNMLEPLLILIVGTLVAVILIAMYMPMFKLGGVIG